MPLVKATEIHLFFFSFGKHESKVYLISNMIYLGGFMESGEPEAIAVSFKLLCTPSKLKEG